MDDATESLRPVVDASPSLLGRVVASKYVVRQVLGRGGMGIVVRAQHLALDQPVALKFLLGSTPTASARFQREARIVFQLTGEHIVRLFDVGTLEDGAPFLVMELVQGETLAERLARGGPLAVDVAIDFVLQACVGLAEAHRAAIVHRDLKPSNLMLTARADGSPLVKVLDFGIAKIVAPTPSPQVDPGPPSVGALARLAVAETVSSEPDVPADKTHTTAIIGSPLYMSPEQIERPTDVDARSDVWALGVVLHELISGAVPFKGDSMADVAAAITEKAPVLMLDGAGGDALESVIRRCLERDPARRFQDVGELAAALAPLGAAASAPELAERAARVLARPPNSTPDAFSRRVALRDTPTGASREARKPPRWALWAAIAAAAPAGVVLVAWLATRERGPSTRADAPQATDTVPIPSSSVTAGRSEVSVISERCPPGMIFVPKGSFPMGLPKGAGHDRASPERMVRLSSYCIDRTEVTVEAYQACVDTARDGLQCTRAKTKEEFRADPPLKPISIDDCNAGVEGRAQHPINCVDWDQATTYCKWVSGGRGQLPTEAQWERAARGTDRRIYPWGNEKPSVERVNGNDESYAKWRVSVGLAPPSKYYPGDDGWASTAPVGSFPKGASPIGALDMAGNVWEWTADYFAPYDRTALVDPFRSKLEPGREDAHTLRGGAWSDNQDETTRRVGWRTHTVYPDLGFRCAAPVP